MLARAETTMASDDEFRQQLDLFIPFIAELSLRDQRETMERPFFSLSKGRRLKPIEYRSPDGSIWIDVLPHPRFGMATIWDADILIWAISVITELRRRGRNDIPRTLAFHPYELLKAIDRPIGGTHYERLREALGRLQTTTIRTNIRAHGTKKFRQFSWLESWSDLVHEDTGNSKGMSITLADWLYEGVIADGGILAISPVYFAITGGRERWLYRVARKHAGGAGQEGFTISVATLFVKSGAEGSYRRFKFELKRIADRNELPEFYLEWLAGQEEPSLRMVRRDELPQDHVAWMPSRRRQGAPSHKKAEKRSR
jgi:plasmid replication initiation protein